MITPVTAVLVDDHVLIRQGLRRALEDQGEVQVVAECATVVDGLRQEEELRPHVLVVDINLPDGSGLDLVQAVRARRPRVGIVVVTMYNDDDHLLAALTAGASGYVTKSASADDVVAAVRHAVTAPESFASAGLAEALRRRMAGPVVQLTEREAAVLALLKEGLATAAVAQHLYISQSTAKSHIRRLYEKLGAGNRTQAIMAALRLGLIEADHPSAQCAD